ncbi:MAG TPA: hypothetical protein VEL03_14295 [Streptosporangiaceae bacterium]|nr:hypothetical protein [Streptosporangiaceae bacterium]
MAQGTHALGRGRNWAPRRAIVLLVALAAIALGGVYYVSTAGKSPAAAGPTAAQLRLPAAATSVLTGSPAAIAAEVSHDLYAAAPVVVVTSGGQPAEVAAAARDALRRHVPLLLTGAGVADPAALSSAVRAEIRSLHPADVLAVGLAASALARQLPGVSVISSLRSLPATVAPAPLRTVALLVRTGRPAAALTAATTTAQAAGAKIVALTGYDPRADPAAITALAASKPRYILALGAGFGTTWSLADKVAVAETGVQLPGGGEILFPGHRLVAMYGHPGTPGLGALGEQGLSASIARVRALAAPYQALSKVPVVPAFEIIATVALSFPSPNGLYSYETPVAQLRPWVRRANKDGLYVILDLQPGRANLLTQAKLYTSLLKLPDVGLALDPEWKLQPGQLPLQQIGSVNISEINSVVSWLAALTARYHLPQKLLVLHQFRLSMIVGESKLDTHHADLAIVIHMDGQGTPADKMQTWEAVTAAAPKGVFFGWKNFFVKDHPMLTPAETMQHYPQPVMISYQ